MAFVQQNFSAEATIGITVDGLTNAAYAVSTNLNSTTTGAISAIIQLVLTVGNTVNTGDYISVYIARSLDNVTYDTVNNNLQALASFTELVANTQQFFTIDTSIVGTLPPYWQLVVYNGTTSPFGTGSSCNVIWRILQDVT